MTDDTRLISHRLRIGLAFVATILIILGIATVGLLIRNVDAVDTLRRSSARNECRARVLNDRIDYFQRGVSELLDAAAHQQRDDVERIAHDLANQPGIQDTIDKECPKPIVDPGEQP